LRFRKAFLSNKIKTGFASTGYRSRHWLTQKPDNKFLNISDLSYLPKADNVPAVNSLFLSFTQKVFSAFKVF